MGGSNRGTILSVLGVLLCLFTLAEVNYPHLSPQSQLAIFALLGMVTCYLVYPARRGGGASRADWLFVALTVLCCGFIVVQTEPLFERLWLGGQALGHRAGQETAIDWAVGILGIVLVIEATRRALGPTLPLLASVFIVYALAGPYLPGWLLPHRGYSLERIVSQTFLHSQGVFGVALGVMFTYVFLFVLLGAFLERTGATQFIIDLARGLFHRVPGGPAKIAVIASGLAGSLSGSAVANTATTGTFTIPMMRSSGFKPEIAAGIEAAASSGGALVPPVMGAGAYMMLEIVNPPVTNLQIIKAALLPAVLYYFSLWLIVHFYSRRWSVRAGASLAPTVSLRRFEAVIFVNALAGVLGFLLLGYTPFRAVTLALVSSAAIGLLSPRTRLSGRAAVALCAKACRDAVPLIAAAACVGIILGVVTLTGAGTRFAGMVLPLAERNLLLALILIMVSSIVLGMGLPSAVCYLLLATLIGPVLGGLGVVPLAAHFFIFYFGMMSMVTPPVALAAYTAASIAGTNIMRTSFAAFRFALVGFTLPYMFVLRPELLMLGRDGGGANPLDVVYAVAIAILGITPFAAGIAGHMFTALSAAERATLFIAAALLLIPGPQVALGGYQIPILVPIGVILLAAVSLRNRRSATGPAGSTPLAS